MSRRKRPADLLARFLYILMAFPGIILIAMMIESWPYQRNKTMIKLINFFEMPHLNQLRHEMEAPLTKEFKASMEISPLDEEEIRKLGIEGLDVDLE